MCYQFLLQGSYLSVLVWGEHHVLERICVKGANESPESMMK